MTLNRGKLIGIFAVEIAAFAFLAGALLDRRMHQRDQLYGVNQWGYRGETRASKEPGEIRVALIGGSSAFERDLSYGWTLAGQLDIELRNAGAPTRRVYSVVNLSEPQAGADSYVDTLRDYAFLEPDVVCIFDGYDELERLPSHARHRSFVFRATGYLPTLPARMLGRPGWLSDQDGGVAELLREGRGSRADVSCAGASAVYCAAMAATARFALRHHHTVIVVSPPSVSSRHAAQQRSLAVTLDQEFGRELPFRYLDLGASIDLSNRVHSPDGLHRTNIGNHVIGQKIASAILTWPLANLVRADDK